jgi:hypothetical protein
MSLASPTNTAVLLSDGTKGRCFGKDVGLTALKNLLPKAREVKERPLNREKTAERREAGEPANKKQKTTPNFPIGSGKYPYTKFVAHVWQLLRQELEKGPVLLVAYSFSCRAVSLIFSEQSNMLTTDDLKLVKQNLKGIVFLSPPYSSNKKKPSDNAMDSDWSLSYGFVPDCIPMHFVLGELGLKKQTTFVNSIHSTLIAQKRSAITAVKTIQNSKGIFVGCEQKVATFVDSLLLAA